MTYLLFIKKYFLLYSVIIVLLPFIFLCETITIPEGNDINTPTIVKGYNTFSFVVNADSLTCNFDEIVDFNAHTVLINLYVENCKSGNGKIFLIQGLDEKLVDYFTKDSKIEDIYNIKPMQMIKISLNKFSGKVTFRVSKNS